MRDHWPVSGSKLCTSSWAELHNVVRRRRRVIIARDSGSPPRHRLAPNHHQPPTDHRDHRSGAGRGQLGLERAPAAHHRVVDVHLADGEVEDLVCSQRGAPPRSGVQPACGTRLELGRGGLTQEAPARPPSIAAAWKWSRARGASGSCRHWPVARSSASSHATLPFQCPSVIPPTK